MEADQQEFRSRPLHVKLSSSTGAKRSATSVLSQVGPKTSPPPTDNVNGKSQQNPAAEEEDMPTGGRAARTLGLMNIPDTVNDTRIRTLVEPFGKLVKIVLRPDHQGAIVEFSDVRDAGKASLGLEGAEISSNRKIHVGTVSDMLKQREEKKDGRQQPIKEASAQGGSSTSTSTAAVPNTLFQTGPIRRPQQPGRIGRRGGLGVKRGGFPTAHAHAHPPASNDNNQ